MYMTADNTGRRVLNDRNFALARFYMSPAAFNRRRHGRDGIVAAHIQVPAGIHKDDAVIGFVMNGFTNERTEHVLMTSCFKHYRFPQIVLMLFQVDFLFSHCLTGEFSNTADNQTSGFAASMRINSRKHS